MKLIVFSLIILNFAIAQKKVKDEVVAEVEDGKIYKSELMSYYEKNLNFVRSDKKVTLESSLDDLINRRIGMYKGKVNKIQQTPEVISKINDIIYHAQLSKDLEPQFKKIGKISDSEVKKYCKENPEYRTAHILIRLQTKPTPEQVASALEQQMVVYQELKKKPENFSAMAKKYSQTNNSKTGSDLGFQPKTRLTPEYYAAIKNKPKGFITKPFRSQYGIHIAKVLDVKPCDKINKNLYKKIVYDIKRDAIINAYYEKERKNKKIKIYKDRLK